VTGLRPGVRTEPIDLPPGDAAGDLAAGDLAVGDAAGDAERGVRAKIGDCDAADAGEPTGLLGPGVPGGGGLAGAGTEGGDRGGLLPGPDIVSNQMRKSNNAF